MRHVGRTLALLAALLSAAGWAQNNTLQDVRVWAAPDRTRVVFDLTGPFKHDMFRLENPDRLVVDVPDARRAEALAKDFAGKGFVRQVRSGVRNGDDLRLVLDLAEPVAPNMFTLEPNQQYGHRLVLDLENGASNPQRQPEATEPHYGGREFVVAIDAGHGGEDPGAVGPSGTREKDIVLKISRELERLIAAEPGMRPVMIRDGDYYVGLRERMDKAREARADLFVSVHADAFRDRRAKGSSVYVLSRSGATSEHARWLAEQENAADLIGGVTLRNKDADLASFMLDLSQGASIEASLDVGGRVLREIRQINDLHKHEVQQAGFLVLKSLAAGGDGIHLQSGRGTGAARCRPSPPARASDAGRHSRLRGELPAGQWPRSGQGAHARGAPRGDVVGNRGPLRRERGRHTAGQSAQPGCHPDRCRAAHSAAVRRTGNRLRVVERAPVSRPRWPARCATARRSRPPSRR